MSSLELKIPPPVVALLVALAMWGIARLAPAADEPSVRIAMAFVLAVVGVAFSASGAVAFRRAKTTKNPMKPQAASSLVIAGVYKITRNPMYLGLSLVLLGWAVFLWSAWAYLGRSSSWRTSLASKSRQRRESWPLCSAASTQRTKPRSVGGSET